MKKLNLILVVIILQNCFPSFKPKEEVKEELKHEKASIKWIKVEGILDQNYPDYIIMEKDNLIDTICEAHNISGLNLKKDTLIITFDGYPKRYATPINVKKEALGLKIKIQF